MRHTQPSSVTAFFQRNIRRFRTVARLPRRNSARAGEPTRFSVAHQLKAITHSPYHEFLPPATGLTATPPSRVRVAFLIIICGLISATIAVSCIGQIDEYAIATGKIEAFGRTKEVQPTDGGIIRSILVRNGSNVRAGDLLIALDPTAEAADRTSLMQQVQALNAEITRRRFAINFANAGHLEAASLIVFPISIPVEFQNREKGMLVADLAKLRSTVDVARSKIEEDVKKRDTLTSTILADEIVASTDLERVKMRSALAAQGWDARTNVIDAQEELEKQNSSLAASKGQSSELSSEIATLNREINESIADFVATNSDALEQAENKRDQQVQDLVKADHKFVHTYIRAPIDGTVQELSATTVGQVVSAGQQLMTIVPRHDTLQVEALVRNEDIGFVKLKDPVVIKLDSFPFTRYGTISGEVRNISRDSVDSVEAQKSSDTQQAPISPEKSAGAPTPKMSNLVFPVTITLDQHFIVADGQKVPLSPGMSVIAEIRTERRRVIDYLLSPLEEVVSDAAHEQ